MDKEQANMYTILKKLDEIEAKLQKLEDLIVKEDPYTYPNEGGDQPYVPNYPFPWAEQLSNVCGKCGMRWDGVMNYICMSDGCPMHINIT